MSYERELTLNVISQTTPDVSGLIGMVIERVSVTTDQHGQWVVSLDVTLPSAVQGKEAQP